MKDHSVSSEVNHSITIDTISSTIKNTFNTNVFQVLKAVSHIENGGTDTNLGTQKVNSIVASDVS